MTRIDFKLPPKQALDQSQVDKLVAKGKVQSSPNLALLLNSGKTGAMAIAGTVKLVKEGRLKHSAPQGYIDRGDARLALHKLASGLVDAKGKVHSGYMSLSDDGKTLSNTSRWTSGNRSGAVAQVRSLIEQGYGDRMAELGMKESLNQAIDNYLKTSGGKLGTRSLVALVRELERKLGDDPQFLAQAQVGKARLQAGAVQAERLPTQSDQALEKLRELYESQDHVVLKAELAAIRNEYPWAEGNQVSTQPLAPGHADYQLRDYASLKVMERLATERGLGAQGFFRLLQMQGPEVLIAAQPPHPNPWGRELHADLSQAFRNARTLSEFAERVDQCCIALQERMQVSAQGMRADPARSGHALQLQVAAQLHHLALGQEPVPPQPTESRFELPDWQVGQGQPRDAQTLYNWGAQLMFQALLAQADFDRPALLKDWLQVAPQALAEAVEAGFDGAVQLDNTLEELLAPVADNSLLAFGRDCLRQALAWPSRDSVDFDARAGAPDHPYTQLASHPYLRASP